MNHKQKSVVFLSRSLASLLYNREAAITKEEGKFRISIQSLDLRTNISHQIFSPDGRQCSTTPKEKNKANFSLVYYLLLLKKTFIVTRVALLMADPPRERSPKCQTHLILQDHSNQSQILYYLKF